MICNNFRDLQINDLVRNHLVMVVMTMAEKSRFSG